eukprot:TRINITY_DN7327_c0_g3_i1.p1 TRINITY_DN7327_c0_g3~~TRINITY_DN7327_c0_g3_i1.p1  ORF type:complete len:376 (-),score=83.93 TRINITY_DN7327_c0_g3_i1:418-1545(-)
MDLQRAHNVMEGEGWLPSELLVEETLTLNRERVSHVFESPYNSPVESVAGSTSTETESEEEDDYMADLALQMAHSMLDDDDHGNETELNLHFQFQNNILEDKSGKPMSRSPQSILKGFWHEGRASSNQASMFGEGLQNLSYGHRAHDSVPPICQEKGFSRFPKESPQVMPRSWTYNTKDEGMKFLPHHHQRQISQQVHPWVRQQTKVLHPQQALNTRAGSKSGVNGRNLRSDYHAASSVWPPGKQTMGSGMRAVFLGTNGSRRESGGTGVFLPRRTGCNSDLRRKPSCSTVLLPSRIVHALNLNLEEMNSQPSDVFYNHREALLSTPKAHQDVSSAMKPSSYCKASPQNVLMDYSHTSQLQSASEEVVLPQEWTY